MLNTNALFYIIFLFLELTLPSCSSPKPLVYSNFKNFSVDKLGFDNSQVKLDLEYYNPNNYGLQLRSSELDLFINNSFLGHSISDSLINIPRRDTFLIPVKFSVDMRNLFKNAWNTFTKNELLIKINGKVKLGKANVFMTLPVNYEGKHKFTLF